MQPSLTLKLKTAKTIDCLIAENITKLKNAHDEKMLAQQAYLHTYLPYSTEIDVFLNDTIMPVQPIK